MHAFCKEARASAAPAEFTGDAAAMGRAQNSYWAFKFEKKKKWGIEKY